MNLKYKAICIIFRRGEGMSRKKIIVSRLSSVKTKCILSAYTASEMHLLKNILIIGLILKPLLVFSALSFFAVTYRKAGF